MSKYIFVTNEGNTYKPNSESLEPDCENSQVIGITSGINEMEALNRLLLELNYLENNPYREIYCYKLDDSFKIKYFNLDSKKIS